MERAVEPFDFSELAAANGDGEVRHSTEAPMVLPTDLVQELRQLLAEALVRDYLDDQSALKSKDGAGAVGDTTPAPPVGKDEAGHE
jgi:hypothetical protein